MSYGISIWDPRQLNRPLPASFQEACEVLVHASSLRAKPNPRLIELATQLGACYPSRISYPAGDPGAEDAVFLTHPVTEASEMERALWQLDVPSGVALSVLRDAVRFARPLGLAVMDDQLGIYFDPKNGVLPPAMAETWQAVEDALEDEEAKPKPLINKAYLRKRFNQELESLLEPKGFKLVKDENVECFVREIEDGRQRIFFILTGSSPDFRIDINLNVFNTTLEKINAAVFPEKSYLCAFSTVLGCFEYPGENVGAVSKEGDIVQILRIFEDRALPLLDCCTTLEGLEWLLNTEDGQALLPVNMHKRHRGGAESLVMCMAAWLMRNPRFEAIVAEEVMLHAEKGGREKSIDKLHKMAEHLRRNVPPVAAIRPG